MSAPTGGASINRNPGLVGQEYVGLNPALAGALPSVAAGDHVHPVLASSAKVIGWGKMPFWRWGTFVSSPKPNGFPLAAGVYPLSVVDVPDQWTIEAFIQFDGTAPGVRQDGGDIFFGWYGASADQPVQFLSTSTVMGTYLCVARLFWPVGESNVNTGAPEPGTGLWSAGDIFHVFVQMNAQGQMSVGVNGQVYGPFDMPDGCVPLTEGFPGLFAGSDSGGTTAGGDVGLDEFRLSTQLRYPMAAGDYDVPQAPFVSDAETLILWHFDEVPYGPYFTSSGGAEDVWTAGQWNTADSSSNSISGQFGFNNWSGQEGGPSTWYGAVSTVGPDSGTGAASSVESLQGATGNFLLEDPAGNVLPLATVDGAQVVQTAITPTLQAPATNPPVSGTVYQNTQGCQLQLLIEVDGSTGGTVQLALGTTDDPADYGPAITVGADATLAVPLTVPAGWYWSITASDGVTVGEASGLGL